MIPTHIFPNSTKRENKSEKEGREIEEIKSLRNSPPATLLFSLK